MSNFKEIIDRYKKELLGLNHVVGVGYGLKEKRGRRTGDDAIIILVDKKLPKDKIKSRDTVPQAVEHYRTDVIEVGEINFLEERTAKMRPAQPGISVGHYKISAGTLGAVVLDKRSGQKMILSNNHVLANVTNGYDNRSKIGDPILQPGSYDDGDNPKDVIAHLYRFKPIRRGSGEPQCGVAIAAERFFNVILHIFRSNYNLKFFKQEGNNVVDCALAKPINANDLDDSILGIGKINGIRDPEVDLKVQKSGRTTGLTTGKILAIGASVNVNMGEKETATFDDQFVTTPMSKPGDSGSMILDIENNVVGLLFAGSDKATICNRIRNVIKQLEIEFPGV